MANPAQRLESDLLAYEGMLVDETRVWRAWAMLYQTDYQRFDHNFRLGEGNDPGPGFLPEVRRGEILNSQMRIDSVGWNGIDVTLLPSVINGPGDIYALFPSAQATIFEVKRRATLQAYGEILGHWAAWLEAFPENPVPLKTLICASYANTIGPATRYSNIGLDVVQVNFSILSSAHGT